MLEIKNLTKVYKDKNEQTTALKDINLKFGKKGFIVLSGKSGSGKSTLLNIIGGLDKFDCGETLIHGISTKDFDTNDWDRYRNTYVGFIFQEFYLIENLTVGENIALALELQGYQKENIHFKVNDILNQVGLDNYQNRKPNELSGGEKQRIAIARALIKDPQIILCDEPTGNLDSETGHNILEILQKLSKTRLVIMVTHDKGFALEFGDRIIELKDGKLLNDYINVDKSNDDIKNVIEVPKGKQLSQDIINYINDNFVNEDNDLYIGISEKDFVKQFTTNEKNKVDHTINYIESVDEDNYKDSLQNINLSYKTIFKMAFHSLFNKKLKLVFMSILFVISLVIVNIALNLTFYNSAQAAMLTFEENNTKFIPFIKTEFECFNNKNKSCEYMDSSFEESEISHFNSQYDNIKFYPTIDISISLDESKDINVETVGLIDNVNLDLAYGTYPINDNEILVSDYIALSLVDHLDLSSIENIINKSVNYNDQAITITGIVNTDYSNFTKNEAVLADENQIVFKQAFMFKKTYDKYFADKSGIKQVYFHYGNDSSQLMVTYASNVDSNFLVGTLPEKDDEIIVTVSYLNKTINENNEKDITEFIGEVYPFSYNVFLKRRDNFSTAYIEIKDYKIVGIINDVTESNYDIIFSDEEYFTIVSYASYNPFHIRSIAVLGNSATENVKFFKQIESLNYPHLTSYSEMLEHVKNFFITLKIILYIVGGIFSIFASLLIFTFISSNIKFKQKDIGILRALGARGKDVARIFILEALIIIIFSSLVANILSGLTINKLNEFAVNKFNLDIVLLYINIYSFILTIVLALVVVLISSYIPIKRALLMKPIKVIKDL